ncbi:MAG: glycine cleavage system aminomethyltransferase GcvT [Promethearchaeota archaeon]
MKDPKNPDGGDLKKTPLYDAHIELGAKMVEFAGWLMPVQYEGIIKEHKATRASAGAFDICHMGELLLEGPDAFSLLQYLMVNDLQLVEPNKGQYSCMCHESGTVVDDMFYYMETPERFRLIVNAGNVEKDIAWIRDHAGDADVGLSDLSRQRGRVAFQGPKSDQLFQPLVDVDLPGLERFHFVHCELDGHPVFLARTGYTGERGVELSFDSGDAPAVWAALLDTGATPVGLGARDLLRLEACYSLYGHEISDEITPVEAGVGWVVKPKEGVDYIGKEVLLRQKREGTEYTSVGLNLVDRGILRADQVVRDAGSGREVVGRVTSGGFSPTLGKTIGLARVKAGHAAVGSELLVEIRGKQLRAVVVETPFYRNV